MMSTRLRDAARVAGIAAATAAVVTVVFDQLPPRIPAAYEFRLVPGETYEWSVPGTGSVIFRVHDDLPSYAAARVEEGVELDINPFGETVRTFTFRRGERVITMAQLVVVGVG